jgi:plastocyanin
VSREDEKLGVRMKKIGMFLAAMALIGALITGCGGSGGSSKSSGTGAASASESSPAAAAGPTITIANMAYGQPITVPPGSEVNIANNDSVEHSVTSDTSGAFSQDVEANEKAKLTAPSQPGEYAFHCKYHPNMHGTLIVK